MSAWINEIMPEVRPGDLVRDTSGVEPYLGRTFTVKEYSNGRMFVTLTTEGGRRLKYTGFAGTWEVVSSQGDRPKPKSKGYAAWVFSIEGKG